jgi:predicted nucleic acid-binding protein
VDSSVLIDVCQRRMASAERETTSHEAMAKLGVGYSPVEQKAASTASRAWRKYLVRGGRRQRVAADFLVGAHAFEQANRLLTRDRGFYHDYFARLSVVDPS